MHKKSEEAKRFESETPDFARANGGFRKPAAFPHRRTFLFLCSRYTSIAISGHIFAHIAQPVHFSRCSATAGKNPLLLKRFLIDMTPRGQVSTQ
jgi:hypothetical protein